MGPDIANPATASVTIESLFPESAAAFELREAGIPALLWVAEAAAVRSAAPKRVEEFAAGRLCARRALERFGVRGFALRAAHDRQPIWPESVVGSITHTSGFCAAVVGKRVDFDALGLDTERADAVKTELWGSVCVAQELSWLDSLPETARVRAATLIFSAKEAVYKCQYPLTGERLNFSDLRVTLTDRGQSSGSFTAVPTRSLAVFECAGFSGASQSSLRGNYRFHDEFVSAGTWLAAEGGS